MLVNKCNKITVNITKDIGPKFIPFHKMCEASEGQKYLYKTSPKALKFTPSHLICFSDSASFGVFLGALSLSMSTSMDSRGFTFNIFCHSCIITRGLAKTVTTSASKKTKTKKTKNFNNSHLQFWCGLLRVCEELRVRHEDFTTSA
jgi:hypothetical protein